jgi:hypothetical protein
VNRNSKDNNRSRYRKAKMLDALGVALLMLFCALLGMITLLASAPHAKADADPVVVAYAAHYAGAVCETLSEFPSTNGLLGIMSAITDDGLTPRQAGQVAAISVLEACPRYAYLLDAFVAQYGETSVA